MNVRQVFICFLLSFTAGLIVASFAGFREFIPGLLEGAWMTIQITFGGCIVAVLLALIAGLCKMYAPWPVRWLAIAYIETFRGTSALVQLFWLFSPRWCAARCRRCPGGNGRRRSRST
jgi:polar amino acid transport system permease protein